MTTDSETLMHVNITCLCGIYAAFPANDFDEAQNKARARGWKYTRVAVPPTKPGDMLYLDGVCQECSELGCED